MEKKCENCKHLILSEWGEALGGDYQTGGYCHALRKTLALTNSAFRTEDYLHVQKSFSCSLFSEKEKPS